MTATLLLSLFGVLGVLACAVVCAVAVHGRLPRRAPYRTLDGTPPFAFPPGFVWGAACADHQVEHAQLDDWTAFEQRARAERRDGTDGKGVLPGHIKGIVDVPALWLEKKTDFDARFEEDFDLARDMGHSAHRLSLSWARLFPHEDMTAPDPSAVAFYSRILDALLERKLTPFVTLFHFASPQWLWRSVDGKRGVERADAVDKFDQMTDACARAFGDRVSFWTTLNEPMVYAVMGYLDGFFPPNERRTQRETRPVVDALLAMHRRSWATLKSDARRRGNDNHVGIAQHVRTFMPWHNGSLLDRLTALGIERQFVWEFLSATQDTSDYIGINYYGRYYVKARTPGAFDIIPRDETDPTEERSDLGWPTDNAGLEAVLVRAAHRYKKPLYILENGAADGADDDVKRRRFLLGQTQAVWRAIDRGADVRGYFYWSLTDNFEWAEGFGPRFGLVKVDYADGFKRTLRPSGALFRRIATTNAISAEDWALAK